MKNIEKDFTVINGTLLSRLDPRSFDKNNLVIYKIYGKQEMDSDLIDHIFIKEEPKFIETEESKDVEIVHEGDIVFSLISGKASIVRKIHDGYFITQNFVKIIPKIKIDSQYLVYLLNENDFLHKQIYKGLQGSIIKKIASKQIKDLVLPKLPSLKEQQLLGELYFNQLRLESFKKHSADIETNYVLKILNGR